MITTKNPQILQADWLSDDLITVVQDIKAPILSPKEVESYVNRIFLVEVKCTEAVTRKLYGVRVYSLEPSKLKS